MKKQYWKIKILHHQLLFRLRTKKNRKQNNQTKNTHNKQCLAENTTNAFLFVLDLLSLQQEISNVSVQQ